MVENVLAMGAVRCWKRLPSGVVASLSLEILKTYLDDTPVLALSGALDH